MPRCVSGVALTLPLIVIDFEATALTLQSYPIEVGLAIARTAGNTLDCWSSLDAPDPAWYIDDQWDRDAERIHGISRWQLRQGSPPAVVMRQLNTLVDPGATVWCDGGHYDVHWLGTLAAAAGVWPHFVLGDLASLVAGDAGFRQRYLKIMTRSVAPHRAGPDAERICAGLIEAGAV